MFDSKTIEYFNNNLEKITTSHRWMPDQKINIINQSFFPMLIYPLQYALLLSEVPKSLTSQIDVMIRRIVKAVGLPASITNEMFYALPNFRGLGLLRTEWEAQN